MKTEFLSTKLKKQDEMGPLNQPLNPSVMKIEEIMEIATPITHNNKN
jgi:hypothetical protein